MGTYHMLECALNEILYVINPKTEDLQTRLKIIAELQDVVKTIESLRGATVEPFGSFLSQLFTRWGDLDISIELSNGSYISTAARKLKQTLLGDVLKALRRTGSFRRLQSVAHARVPILKLESKYQNISCDISINNLSGQMKSKFLLWISYIDRRYRDMVLLVKEWAKANGINNPKTGTLNSYSLSLLIIFHFQTCDPPILPPLREIYAGNMADELIGVRADVESHIQQVTFENIGKFRKERRVNNSSLSELFISFLAKFSDISTKATYQGISTFTGQWEDIHTNTRWLPRTYAIFIEDPFEQPENSARAVSPSQLTRIAETFSETYHRLMAPNQTRNFVIPLLVRREISQYFPGAAFGHVISNGGVYSRTHQNTYPNNYSSGHYQPQFQKPRQANRPMNLASQYPKQATEALTQAFSRNSLGNKSGTPSNRVTRHGPARVSRGQSQQANPELPHALVLGGENDLPSNRVTRHGPARASQGQSQQVNPELPHALVLGRENDVPSQRLVKAAQTQAQQVWRPKQHDNYQS